jgi:ABC-type transport system substrate-binding protein
MKEASRRYFVHCLARCLGLLVITAPICAPSLAWGQPQATGAGKTLHVLLTTPEAAMDPAVAADLATLSLDENVFDPMLRYDYLARPVKLLPNTLTAMPEVGERGLSYTFHLQPGILFTPDPAFKGKPRELMAQDYAYSIKRIYDPAIKSPWLFMFDGKLSGDE